MKLFEFVIWWLSKPGNDTALIAYIVIGTVITGIAFANSVLVGIFLAILFGSPLVALLGYLINREVRKTYAQWLAIRDKQQK